MENRLGGKRWLTELVQLNFATSALDQIPPRTSLGDACNDNDILYGCDNENYSDSDHSDPDNGSLSNSLWSEILSPRSSDKSLHSEKLTTQPSDKSLHSNKVSIQFSNKSLPSDKSNTSWHRKHVKNNLKNVDANENESCHHELHNQDSSKSLKVASRSSDISLAHTTPSKDVRNREKPWKLLHSTGSVESKIQMCNYNKTKEDPIVCYIYITPSINKDINEVNTITSSKLKTQIESILLGTVKMHETSCGLVCEFTNENDADRITRLPLGKVFGESVVAWKYMNTIKKYKKIIIVRDIPWCVPITEIHNALRTQGIKAGKITRRSGVVRIEVKNAIDAERLLKEGLSFFDCATFSVELDSCQNSVDEPEILQCYRCQRFWHTSLRCHFPTRCVRCGNNHEVSACEVPRDKARCCLCGGSHHAAHKLCPVRIQHANSIQIDFSLSRKSPPRSLKSYYD